MPATSEAAPALHDIARRSPRDLAIEDERRRVSWGELEERTNAVGNGAEAMGLTPGDHVAVVAGNRVEYIEALLGVQRAGMVVTPVKTGWTPDEVEYLLRDAGTRLVVTDVDAAREAARRLAVPILDLHDGFEAWLERQSRAPLPRARAGWRMSYTSGTTGRPKGVVRVGAGTAPFCDAFAASAAMAERLHLPGEGTHLMVSRLFHGAPLTFGLATLARGAVLRILGEWDPAVALQRLEACTSTCMVPTMFRQLLSLPEETRAAFRPKSLRTVAHGGEPCPVELKRRMLEWWGPVLVEYYGFTEGGMTVVTSEEWLARPGTVGRAVTGGRIVVLGGEGEELPARAEGAIYFTGEAERPFWYHNDPAKTAGSYAGRAFTAGDIGWLDEDGYLYISGRKSEVIVSAGVNVYPAEIEPVLLDVRGVADACVVGAPDDVRGESPAAFVSLVPGADRDAVLAAIERACAERLAGYKRPRALHVRDEMPRDGTGKLLRGRLRDELWRGRSAFAAAHPPPRTDD